MIEEHPLLERIVRLGLEEDLGSGDITTEAIVDPRARGKAFLIAREELVLAGLPVFKRVFLELSRQMEFEEYFSDGELVPEDKSVCLITGPLSSILKGERTALNFLQRMSGIATLTRQYVEKVKAFRTKVLDTRKTCPGLRWLDKYAVRVGGGHNHRFGLFDGILIKDNHIATAGSITVAVERVKRNAPHIVRVQIEVEDLAGVEEALLAGADAVLLDNMTPEEMAKAVQLVNGRIIVEASGGINLDTIEEVARSGVDLISVGALTHSPKAADFSLEISPVNRKASTDGVKARGDQVSH